MTQEKRLGKLARKEALDCYLFISPWIIGFLIFTLGPMLFSVFLSFCRWDIFTPAQFIGLGNYRKLAADPPQDNNTPGRAWGYGGAGIQRPAGVVTSARRHATHLSA